MRPGVAGADHADAKITISPFRRPCKNNRLALFLRRERQFQPKAVPVLPMKRILVINNYDSFVYNLVQLVRESPLRPTYELMLNDQIDYGRLDEFGGILLSPGPGVPAEAHGLLPLIRRCHTTHPLLGVCLGHQAIAEALGGHLNALPAPKHGHRSPLRLTDVRDPLWQDAPAEIYGGRYHSWVADPASLPAELAVSSVDEENNIMSFYHRRYPVFGLQFHPESFLSNCGRRLIDNWLALTADK